MFTTTYLASGWYEEFLKWIPEGEIFNLRVVFEAIPGILKELPNTILLTLAGAFFWFIASSIVCHCQNQSGKNPLPDPSLVCEFFKRTPILVQFDADLLWNPAPIEGH